MIREAVRHIRKRGGFTKIIKNQGFFTSIDSMLIFLQYCLRRSFYKIKDPDYGFSEALFFSREIDYWSRYADTIREIRRINGRNFSGKYFVLEVGSGGKGVSNFLDHEKYAIVLSDVQREALIGIKTKAPLVVADGHKLPFKNEMFDIVVSVDTVEHVPKSSRHVFLNELRRVCKNKIILHFPTEDNSMYKGREYDFKFNYYHRQIFGTDDQSTREHIESIHPTIAEICEVFLDSRLYGKGNCNIWLKYMVLERIPILGFLTGLIYYFFWKKEDLKPPYYGCFCVVDKQYR